jgi:succinyl-diaminopimelate desuccinylase
MIAKDTLFSYIQGSKALIIELETLLTAIPAMAPESGGHGEFQKAEALVAWLRTNGITHLDSYDSPDDRVPSGLRPNVVATIPGVRHDSRLWVMAHLDVVPPGEASLWKTDPWKVVEKDGILYGRGVEDNQQGLVAGVVAALAYIRNGIVPPCDIKLLFVADEEVGSVHGIQYLLKNHKLFHRDDFIIIPDGGDPDGSTIEVAEKNITWLKFTTKGKQCHGSRPDEGRNAFLAGCDLALRLHDLENHFAAKDPLFTPDYSTFSPTKKEANVPNVNTIPGEDVFYMDMRVLPMYSLAQVKEQVDVRMRQVEAKHGVTVFCEDLQSVESKRTRGDAPVVIALQKAIKETSGVDARPIGIGGGTVGAYLRNEGLDAVVWSTLEETAHQPNESARIANIMNDAKVMALVALQDR